MYIEGHITRDINDRRTEIPFYIDTLTGHLQPVGAQHRTAC